MFTCNFNIPLQCMGIRIKLVIIFLFLILDILSGNTQNLISDSFVESLNQTADPSKRFLTFYTFYEKLERPQQQLEFLEEIDSLTKATPLKENPLLICDLKTFISYSYFFYRHFSDAKKEMTEAYRIAYSQGDICRIARIASMCGSLYSANIIRDEQRASRYFEIAYKIASSSSCYSEMVLTLREKSIWIEDFNGDFDKGLLSKLRASEICDKFPVSPVEKFELYSRLGTSEYQNSDYSAAKEHWFIALSALNESTFNPRVLIRTLNDISLVYKNESKNDSAKFYLRKALNIAEESKDSVWIGIINGNYGAILYDEGKLNEAIPFANIDLKYSLKYQEWLSALNTYNFIAKIYYETGRYSEALHILDGAEDLLTEHEAEIIGREKRKTFDYNYKIQNLRSLIYERLGDTKIALQFQRLAFAYNDSVNALRINEKSVKGMSDFLLEKENERVEILNTQKNETEQIIRTQNLLIILFSLAVIVLVLLMILLRRANKVVRRHYTALIQSRHEITEKNRKLDELNKLKDKLFSVVGHELRAPLSNVQGFLQLLDSDLLDDHERKGLIKSLNTSLSNSSDILDNLVRWGTQQFNSKNNKPVTFDIYSLAEDTLHQLQNIHEIKHISLFNKLEKNTFVFADIGQIQFILRNLLVNAIKFTPEYGKIEIFSHIIPNGKISISVKDYGIGMGPEELKKIFNSSIHFTRRGTNNEVGSGLGLLLCQEFIEKNGGKILVESEKGKGTTFSFELNLAD